ncbi:MAG: AMP-binding protein [Solirubrobacterales bacterium]|nr:AMP-binding protein [Solirubrobacterales bacterium]
MTAALPDYDVTDPAALALPREQLRAIQDERLRAMVRYVYERSPFWRRKLTEAEVRPEEIEGIADLARLPFTSRTELDAEQSAHPPFGEYTCSSREQWMGLFTTSGTSGRKLKRVVSRRDWRLMLDRFYRHPAPPPGEMFMLLGPVDGLLGPAVGVEAMRERGAIPVLAGTWDTRTKVLAIAELRPGAIAGAASYIIHLAEVAQEMGVDLASCGLRAVTSFGEPGAAVDATHAAIAERYGVGEIIDGYGLTEVWPLGGNCPFSAALHIADDLAAVECVDPDSGEQLPEGETGEIVFTNLIGDTQPLLRYRSRDVGQLTFSTPCACGSTVTRIERIEGRTDDMIWYRGANFFPSAVEEIVRSHPELTPEYRIVLDDGRRGLPVVTIQVEAASGTGAPEALRDPLRAALRSGLGVNPEVEVLAAGSLPRAQQSKARRVLDRRAGRSATVRGSGMSRRAQRDQGS